MANQQNIQIGIDLGTTNSSIAINNNGNIEIVKKPGGVEYIPSIFGFDKVKNRLGFSCEYNVRDTIKNIIQAYEEKGQFKNYGDPKYHNVLTLKNKL